MRKIFDDLKSAILDVIDSANNTGCEYCYVVSQKSLDNLHKQYKIYFVEPENDSEFQDWQNEQ